MIESRVADGGAPAVVFDHVSKAFGAKQVLRDVSFDVRAGEALCILGRSGTGKRDTETDRLTHKTGPGQDLDRTG